jgi:hypothetical protein
MDFFFWFLLHQVFIFISMFQVLLCLKALFPILSSFIFEYYFLLFYIKRILKQCQITVLPYRHQNSEQMLKNKSFLIQQKVKKKKKKNFSTIWSKSLPDRFSNKISNKPNFRKSFFKLSYWPKVSIEWNVNRYSFLTSTYRQFLHFYRICKRISSN